jgi:uncharacterized membrane protein
MTLLIIGIVIWVALHFLKRVAPSLRAGMDRAMGAKPARGVIALLLVVSIVLMVIGYRAEPNDPVYTPLAGMGHLNNLLMLVSILLFGAGSSKGKARGLFRHPMLMGVIVWAGAHLLVNGDKASVVLFGSMAIWAVVQIVLINRAEPNWTRLKPGPIARDFRLLVIALVLFAIIAAIHIWLGHSPFLGTYA